jgi:3-deoxy-7-phosphoheptulonate synthase
VIIVMKRGASQEEVAHVESRIQELGLESHPIVGEERVVIGAIGEDRAKVELQALSSAPGVDKVMPILQPFKLASRELQEADSHIQVRDITIGNDLFLVIAGPCSVESRDQLMTTARAVKKAGAHMLRGGAFKPRTSPYSFQGMEEEGLKLLAEARDETGMAVVTEVMNPRDIELVASYADILQIGARNMSNFSLLKELGAIDKPILLKRGMMSTVKELLMSAEYIIASGNKKVILCERGIRTFEDMTRNTLDLSVVPLLRQLCHLPVIVDPTHATGKPALVPWMSKASVAAGANGIIVEVHPDPEKALSDGDQALRPHEFDALMGDISRYAPLEQKHV